MNVQKIAKLFPYIEDKLKLEQLKIDTDSIHYISTREYADKITAIIEKHLQKLNINCKDAIITDATSGVGGNTVSFANIFKQVYAIEIDKIRSDYLSNNLEVFNITNVKIYNEDCTKVLDKINDHNVVFIDPPWGGKDYKETKWLKLQIANTSIEMMCNDIANNKIMKKVPELIILKLPTNYDLRYLYKNIKNKQIYLYDLKKMYIIVIIK